MSFKNKSFKTTLGIVILSFSMIYYGCLSILRIDMPERKMGTSIIGLEISINEPYFECAWMPLNVYFVKIDKNDPGKNKIFKSNFDYGIYNYLMNVEPGTYRAVAAFFEDDSNNNGRGLYNSFISMDKTYFFPKELIQLTEVEIKENEIKFLGSFTLTDNKNFSDKYADEMQYRYCRIITPKNVIEFDRVTKRDMFISLKSPFDGNLSYAAKYYGYKNSIKVKNKFLKASREIFNKTPWIEIFAQKKQEIKSKK